MTLIFSPQVATTASFSTLLIKHVICFMLCRKTSQPLFVFVSAIHTVEGIAVDWMADNLYWTDDGPKKTISVARLEKASRTRKTLIEGKMTHPRAIVVDPLHG